MAKEEYNVYDTWASTDSTYTAPGSGVAKFQGEATKYMAWRKKKEKDDAAKAENRGKAGKLAWQGYKYYDTMQEKIAGHMVDTEKFTGEGGEEFSKYEKTAPKMFDLRGGKKRVTETQDYISHVSSEADKGRGVAVKKAGGKEFFKEGGTGDYTPKGPGFKKSDQTFDGPDFRTAEEQEGLRLANQAKMAGGESAADLGPRDTGMSDYDINASRDALSALRSEAGYDESFKRGSFYGPPSKDTRMASSLDWREGKQTDKYGSFTGGGQHRGTGSGQSVAQEMSEKFYAEYGDDVQFNEQGLPIPKRPDVSLDVGEDSYDVGDTVVDDFTDIEGDYPGDTGLWDKAPSKGVESIPEGFQGGPKGDLPPSPKSISRDLIDDATRSEVPTLKMQTGGDGAGAIKQFMEETGKEYSPEIFKQWQDYELPGDLGGEIASTGVETIEDLSAFDGVGGDLGRVADTAISTGKGIVKDVALGYAEEQLGIEDGKLSKSVDVLTKSKDVATTQAAKVAADAGTKVATEVGGEVAEKVAGEVVEEAAGGLAKGAGVALGVAGAAYSAYNLAKGWDEMSAVDRTLGSVSTGLGTAAAVLAATGIGAPLAGVVGLVGAGVALLDAFWD